MRRLRDWRGDTCDIRLEKFGDALFVTILLKVLILGVGGIVLRVNMTLLFKFLLIIACFVEGAAGETAGQDAIIRVDDALPEIRLTTSLADARGILSVAGYDEIQVAVSRDRAMSFVTEITRSLSAGNRVVFGGMQDTISNEAVLVMGDGYVGELRLRPLNRRHFAQTITAIRPTAVDLIVDPETPMGTVIWIQDQLMESGVGLVVHVRTPRGRRRS